MMTTADMAMKVDPAYRKISERFRDDPEYFADAYARAWFKLIHRDMGPTQRYMGPEVPTEQLIWQDPIPAADYDTISDQDIAALKSSLLDSELTVGELVSTAWASAVTYRGTDYRGGANGARVRLAPQKDWEINNRAQRGKALGVIEGIQKSFNEGASGNKQVSMADLIVLGGCAAIEKASGNSVTVPFTAGRTDASQEQTDIDSFNALEPTADGFRNYVKEGYRTPAEALLVDRACLLGLTAPEMTALVGGMRTLGANAHGSAHGVFTDKPGTLSNDFFVNVLDMNTVWSKTSDNSYEGKDRASGNTKWTGSAVDLAFGSNSELRAIAEVYASNDGADKFAADFVAAWNKVMMSDRFDLN